MELNEEIEDKDKRKRSIKQVGKNGSGKKGKGREEHAWKGVIR